MHPRNNARAAVVRCRRMGRRSAGLVLAFGIAFGCLSAPSGVEARQEYDPTRAGNPLKIVYYVVYPVAFLVDRLIFRPAYYAGQWEPFHTLFGTTRPPEDLDEGEFSEDEGEESSSDDS